MNLRIGIPSKGRLAEIAGEYLKKGRSVYVEGRLKTRKWQDKETGADRYSTDIVADQMQMLGSREGEGMGSSGGGGFSNSAPPPQQQRAPRPAQSQGQRPAAPQSAPANLADMDDDIPF